MSPALVSFSVPTEEVYQSLGFALKGSNLAEFGGAHPFLSEVRPGGLELDVGCVLGDNLAASTLVRPFGGFNWALSPPRHSPRCLGG